MDSIKYLQANGHNITTVSFVDGAHTVTLFYSITNGADRLEITGFEKRRMLTDKRKFPERYKTEIDSLRTMHNRHEWPKFVTKFEQISAHFSNNKT
jgi:hypothetical protein